jgi:hypothetical protein
MRSTPCMSSQLCYRSRPCNQLQGTHKLFVLLLSIVPAILAAFSLDTTLDSTYTTILIFGHVALILVSIFTHGLAIDYSSHLAPIGFHLFGSVSQWIVANEVMDNAVSEHYRVFALVVNLIMLPLGFLVIPTIKSSDGF